MTRFPLHVRGALVLCLLLPVYFAVAALGTKFGLWGWRTGLGTMIMQVGPFLIGFAALVALISLIVTVRKPPRKGWFLAVIALAVPLAIFAGLTMVRARSAAFPPIYDIATDTVNPPVFSSDAMAARAKSDANAVNDYTVSLGQLEPWQGERFKALAAKTHGQLIQDGYPDLAPVLTGETSPALVVDAISQAMTESGCADIRINRAANSVECVAETFWFGFKDDVVARVADGKVDFRSVSRVGLSDLGANAARIAKLTKRVEAKLVG